ncbi:cellular nucleic acid-binding protein [Cryptococcus deuterogattii 99/473]|uniref:Cellular nucleic acid-binding protein n=1 Tax=Cryptococcus deuterogattii Ram5 TaxID=1296110 RepID=A0A0D0U415_9TREE|nr:cellular nucleic acid-binding protein [Cryptococcus deuterogattii LA55]KIR36129.1 cellular nucleic acid-binding protein [Cryptococcus deuterogattii MMRL2647]KIR42913.1 cellular nucleic acid-binding protein [Cryptococcus deuterogattii Ram5]KIR75562.1 cellular nucleic acid-binding protein [Cryptococcus deuterogattii CA1014]KIR95502.1 cellular nucleic acid-binding protein [Cryptococcus deuterogattii CBS 10090]KIS01998.1 cellular nucleic acid-binding protein [Cryptococcus deuterogattii 2001/935
MFGAAAVPGSRQGCFKEPGHESTNCPQPRSTDGKQCYACGGVGHVKSDCPSMRGAFGPGQKCFKCGRPGHLARECTVPGFVGAFRGRGGFGGAFGGRPRPPVNPDGTPVKCYRCNGENHLARDCLAPRDEAAILASKKCYKCQETGHIARDCTKEDVSPAAE